MELDEELLVEAKQGEDGGRSGGGDGYSGGDGFSGGGGNGGSLDSPRGGQNEGDGANGKYQQQGHGSGRDVADITMKWFDLTLGAGGDFLEVAYPLSNRKGGGGGGLVVNGRNGIQNTGRGKYNGEGYGDGGGGYRKGSYANAGCVLIAV